MRIKQVLSQAKEILSSHKDIENPAIESEVLLRHILQTDRVHLHLEMETELDADKEEKYRRLLELRLRGTPVAYLIHHREFFGLDFYVDERVLIPRPETEHLVEEALKCAERTGASVIADIGTGSGAVAISLAVHLPKVQILATDISEAALQVALLNAQKHGVRDRITFLQGDLLAPIPTKVDVIVANLPYIKRADLAGMPFAAFEPASALDGGIEGLEQIFRLAHQLKSRIHPGGYALLEIGADQSKALISFLYKHFPLSLMEVIPDFAGIERIIKIEIRD